VVLASLLVSVGLLSCGKRPSQVSPSPDAFVGGPGTSPGRGEVSEDESTPAPPAPEGVDLALARAIDRKLCRKRGCCVSAIEEAGRDRKGRSLAVATIDAGYGGEASCLVPPPVEPAAFGNGTLDREVYPSRGSEGPPGGKATGAHAREDSHESDGESSQSADESDDSGTEGEPPDDCHPYDYYLVVHAKGKILDRQLLSTACNNGYGAAGVGEDEITVDAEARTFTHTQSGGSSWRWTSQLTVGLDPMRVVSTGRSTFWTLDEDGSSKSQDWNHDTFEGRESWSVPACPDKRKQPDAASGQGDAEGDGPDDGAGATSFEAAIVPRVELPPEFLQGGWRSIALGPCGALVDGDQHGYTVHGGKGSAGDASMRVVMSKDGVLFVEIADDDWTHGGKTWVTEDHLELWLAAPGSAGAEPDCEGAPTGGGSSQWGIRISDGKVFSAFGAPAPLVGVEVVRSGRLARARIPIAGWSNVDDGSTSLAVVYSDSDDGLHQKRLIATSQVKRGQASSLGGVLDLAPAEARCGVKGKRLQIERPPYKGSRDEAVASP